MNFELEQITRYFEVPGTGKRREVLQYLDLRVNPGELIAVTGPSGSGKSTLLNILGTLDKPNDGTVKIDGEDVLIKTPKQLAAIRNRNIGFMFQLHHLLPQLSLIENVLLPLIPQKDKQIRRAAIERANVLLDFVGLADKTTQKPGQLSVGECQRAALVRALIQDPDLLLADEPTGALDSESADLLGDLLVQVNSQKNIAMVVVTHSALLAQKMNVVYQLTHGKLIRQAIDL